MVSLIVARFVEAEITTACFKSSIEREFLYLPGVARKKIVSPDIAILIYETMNGIASIDRYRDNRFAF